MLPFELTKDTHTSPFRASYGVSFMSTSTEIDRVIKGFYCMSNFVPVGVAACLVQYEEELTNFWAQRQTQTNICNHMLFR